MVNTTKALSEAAGLPLSVTVSRNSIDGPNRSAKARLGTSNEAVGDRSLAWEIASHW